MRMRKETLLSAYRLCRLLGWLTRPGNGSNPRALDGCHESSSVLQHPPHCHIRSTGILCCCCSSVVLYLGENNTGGAQLWALASAALSLARHNKDRCIAVTVCFKCCRPDNTNKQDAIPLLARRKELKTERERGEGCSVVWVSRCATALCLLRSVVVVCVCARCV